jgi:anthranilate phosphoribosyltransferase
MRSIPEDFGLSMKSNRGLKVSGAAESKEMVLEAWVNVEGHAARDRNAQRCDRPVRGQRRALDRRRHRARRAALASGAAKRKLDAFVATTQKLGT